MRELENHLDSIQGRIDLFKNSLQTMWMNFINSDVVKFIVDIGTGLIKLVDKVGVLKVAVAGLFAGMFVKHQMKKNNVDLLSFIFETIPTNIKNTPAIQNFASTFKTAFADAMGGVVKANSLDILAELANFDDANNVLGDLANIFGDKSATKDQAKQILDSFDDISDATKDAILGSNLFAASQTGAAAGTNVLTASLTKAKAAVIAFGKGLMAFAAAHPIITGLTAGVLALGAAFAIYDAFTVSHDEYIEKLEEETEELKTVQSELKSVQSELETTKDRMDELQAKGTLSFVEEEELNRLKEQTAELERQEEILLAQEKRARNKQIEAAINAAETDPHLQDYIISGQPATYATNLTSKQGDNTVGMPYGAKLQYSDAPVPTQDKNLGNDWEIQLGYLKGAKEDLDVAIKALSETTYDTESKEYKALEKQVENAQARVDKYNNAIDSMNTTWQSEYGEIGYIENATTEVEKQWNEYYRQYQDYVDQWMLINDGYVNGKATVLDRIFGVTGTDLAKEFKKEFESAVNGGKDPAEVIESLFANKDYSSAFSGLEKQFGITMDNIKAYFTQTGEFAIDPNFDITKYTQDIKSHSAVISEFQDAIQSLEKGTFTMDDYLDLIERFPDLAKGVDISSNAFYGLSRNLNKAIKTRTKSFVRDLQDLRKSMVAAGKSTDSIDQLIEAIENMPDDALDDTIEKYSTLADAIERSRVAQDKLLASMEENPNQGYETRGEALEYMKDAMSKGEIGSESNLWNVAKRYGFTYDSAKSINENADALAKYIAVREKWWKQADDGDDRTKDGYSFEGTENFIQSVEEAVNANAKLQQILKWDYDETTGTLDFDFDNEDLPEIISLLSEMKNLTGLTQDEWMDLMIQVGQFFDIKWGDADDVSDYIVKIAEGSGTAADKIDQMTDSVEVYVEKALGKDVDFSSLTEAGIEAITTDEKIRELLKTYLSLKKSLEDPLNIEKTLGATGSIASLFEIDGLNGSITRGELGYNFINTDTFTSALEEAGYTEDKIKSLIKTIQTYQDIITVTNDDPLGLNSQNRTTQSVISSLQTLGVEYETVKGQLGEPTAINITAKDLITTLQEKGWTQQKIAEYIETLTSTENGLGIQVDGKVDMNKEDIYATIEEINQMPKTETVTVDVAGTAVGAISGLTNDIYALTSSTHVVKVDIQKTGSLPNIPSYAARSSYGIVGVNGTAHALGTAYSSGSWGVPETETSLVGELGPELLVRNGRWTTVGENGAEFTQVKKGDIIFNHKQTESLLKNGYVTGRGKAYASGTAFASGGGTFARYSFSGSGGYTKYDVNDNVVDSFGDLSSAAADAANSISDAADEFKETIDWIEVRLEELDETIGLLNAQLENAVYYTEKNNKIDDIIAKNREKMANLEAGADYYESYISKFWNKIPAQYQEAAKNGAIAITDFAGEASEEVVEAIQNYREYVQKAADLRQQKEEVKSEIRDLAIQKFNNAYDSGAVRATVEDSQTEKLQNAVDYDETRGLITSDAYYVAMMENSNKKIEYLTDARKAMQEELDRAVKAGEITRGSNEWYELIDQMYQIDAQIDEATIELEEFQNAINDIYWENFDQLISRIEYLRDETQSLIDLMDNADMVVTPETDDGWSAEDVQWTDEGLASLGLYAQQMEMAEYQARQYAEAIDDLTTDYEDGLYSENEYLEKLNELKNSQYESIEAYYDAQEAIKDLNQARIDAIKEGIEKEIEAYEELISKKKEELDAEKDLYDFQKGIADQQKDIAEIERQLAAISGDNSASAIAKRKQLEAELAEAREALEESYYDRSIEDRQNALDQELEDFTNEKEAEIEQWEEYMDNVETIVAESLDIVQGNAEAIGQTLTEKAEEYNLTVSDAILSPWADGSIAVSDYQTQFDTAMSSTMDKLEELKVKWQEVIDKMVEAGQASVDALNQENADYAGATYTEPVENSAPSASSDNSSAEPQYTTYTVKSGDNLSVIAKNQLGSAARWQEIYNLNKNVISDPDLIYPGQKLKLPRYAKGTSGVKSNQLAIVDENQLEELVLGVENGRLTYLSKGSSVIPADITSNLMSWGELDPQDMLDRNRPTVGVHPEIHNIEVHIDNSIGKLIHIDNCTTETLPDVKKIVNEALEKHTQRLNQSLRKFAR